MSEFPAEIWIVKRWEDEPPEHSHKIGEDYFTLETRSETAALFEGSTDERSRQSEYIGKGEIRRYVLAPEATS